MCNDNIYIILNTVSIRQNKSCQTQNDIKLLIALLTILLFEIDFEHMYFLGAKMQ